MDQKGIEENDGFDYLSFLKNGFIDNNDNKNIIQIDIESDEESSDDCLIVDLVNNSSTDVNKTDVKDLKSEDVEKEVKSEQKSNKIDVKTEVIDKHLKSFDNKNDLKTNGNKIKTEKEYNLLNHLKTCDSKEMIDKKINFDDKCLIDFKPFDVKLEKINDNIIENDLIDCKKIKSNEISVQTEDIGSDLLIGNNQSSSYQSSCDISMSCTDRQILTAIEKILSQKQQPKFDSVFIMCSKLRDTCPQFSTRFGFMSAINEAKRKGLIQEYSSIDGSILYRAINSGLDFVSSIRKRKSSTGNISSCSNSSADVSESDLCSNKSSNSQSFEHKTINAKKKKYSSRGKVCENTGSVAINCKKGLESIANTQLSFEKEFEELGNLDDCNNFDNIDMSTSGIFADMEVDPKTLLNSTEDSRVIEDKYISMSFKSLPNVSVNHIKNKEVVRKRTTLCHESDEQSSSLVDYENWLTETLPRYSPFIAQKGDRVVYLRDAHEIYVENEIQELKENYKNFQCNFDRINHTIKADDYIIFAVVIEVKFFQLRGIKFSIITLKSSLNEKQFNVLYRPNRGICEFLVLEQFYKKSQEMNWRVNCEFRSLWKKSWWVGVIEKVSVFNEKHPKSLFKCFEIKWNTNERGRLSPWDLFPVDPNRLPKNKSNGIVVTREDLLEFNYRPLINEWPVIEQMDSNLWRTAQCKRIYNGIKTIEKNISKSIVSAFKNVNHKMVSYPVSLQCIKDRLKNMFYRRLDSIKIDVNYMKLNCRSYLKKSEFKTADDFLDLIQCVINDSKCATEEQYLKYIDDHKHLRETKIESTSHLKHSSIRDHSYSLKASPTKNMPKRSLPSHTNTTTKSSFTEEKSDYKKAVIKKKNLNSKSCESPESPISEEFSNKVTEDQRWKEESLKFIDELFKKEETIPFQEPVDVNQYPNYYILITDPTDLSTIKDNLKKSDHYLNPKQLREDFRLMFANAKTYTKNPKAKIRLLAKQLSNLCEDKLREIIVDWERVYAYEKNVKKGKTGREPTSRHQLWGYGAQQYY